MTTERLSNKSAIEFLELFISKIPIDRLLNSTLWNKAVWVRVDEVTQKIVS